MSTLVMPPNLWSVERLETLDVEPVPRREEPPELFQTDWEEVGKVVGRTLESLDTPVSRLRPGARATPGQTRQMSTRAFYLFAYRTFDLPGEPSVDPIVVGVNFAPLANGSGVAVVGDIAGEESGEIFYELPQREIHNNRASVVAAAQQISKDLCQQAEVVARALSRSRKPAVR